jgi:DnaK suppressor protein
MGAPSGRKGQDQTVTRMDQKKLKAFREKLLLKKQEILEAYNKNKTYGKEADDEGSQDIADKASNSYTKEFLFSLSNTERDMLALVDEAIVRIDDRRFGTCVVCEDELDRKRLEAVPWAKRCISCQEKQEQGLL